MNNSVIKSFCLAAFLLFSGLAIGQSKKIPKAPPPPPAPVVAPPAAPTTPAPILAEPPPPPMNAKEIYLEENKVYTVVETQPEFPGGQDAMYQFIGANLIYPAEAKANKVQGKVIAQFIVEKDGTVSTPTIIRDAVNYGASAEVIRVINSMPKWKPGKQDGKEVRVQYTMPFTFKL